MFPPFPLFNASWSDLRPVPITRSASCVTETGTNLATPCSGVDFAKNSKRSTERDEEFKGKRVWLWYGIVDIICVFYLAIIGGFSLLWATGNWKALPGFSFDGGTASMMAVAFGGIR